MLATKLAKELIQTGDYKNVDAVYIGAIPQSEITRTDRTIILITDVRTDMALDGNLDFHALDKEVEVQIFYALNADDPDDVAFDMLEDSIYVGMRMAHPVLGTKETVSSFDHDKLNEYYFNHFTRDEIVVSIAGSFDKTEVIGYFAEKFYNLKEHRADSTVKNISKVPDGSYLEISKEIEQSHLAMGVRLFPADDDRRYPMMLLSNLLGGGMSSRLMQNVRVKKGLAYSVYAMTGFYAHIGVFIISAGVAKERTQEALDAIREELDRLKGDDISLMEFNSSKEQLKSGFIFSQESVQSLMIFNGRNMLTYGRCISPSEVLQTIERITLDDINAIKYMIADYDSYSIINVTGKN